MIASRVESQPWEGETEGRRSDVDSILIGSTKTEDLPSHCYSERERERRGIYDKDKTEGGGLNGKITARVWIFIRWTQLIFCLFFFSVFFCFHFYLFFD